MGHDRDDQLALKMGGEVCFSDDDRLTSITSIWRY
jgi:hypothetical protein